MAAPSLAGHEGPRAAGRQRDEHHHDHQQHAEQSAQPAPAPGPPRSRVGDAGAASGVRRARRRACRTARAALPVAPARRPARPASRSRRATIRARAEGSLGAEARMSRSVSWRNWSHTSSGRDGSPSGAGGESVVTARALVSSRHGRGADARTGPPQALYGSRPLIPFEQADPQVPPAARRTGAVRAEPACGDAHLTHRCRAHGRAASVLGPPGQANPCGLNPSGLIDTRRAAAGSPAAPAARRRPVPPRARQASRRARRSRRPRAR